MSLETQSKINQLLQGAVSGGLLFSEWLSSNGYSPQLVNRYKNSGWLETLCKGVLYRTNDKLSALMAIHSYNIQNDKSIRVAAHSALELQGFYHYVPMGKPNLMVALNSRNRMDWLKSDSFDMKIRPFYTDVFQSPATISIGKNNVEILVSTPEQAFLECLHLVPKYYNYMDLYYIMEQMTSLDPQKVQTALEGTSSQRVKRMFLYMAEKAGHFWFDELDIAKLGLREWKIQSVKGGVYIPKYKITVSKELNDYE